MLGFLGAHLMDRVEQRIDQRIALRRAVNILIAQDGFRVIIGDPVHWHLVREIKFSDVHHVNVPQRLGTAQSAFQCQR